MSLIKTGCAVELFHSQDLKGKVFLFLHVLVDPLFTAIKIMICILIAINKWVQYNLDYNDV